jgi:hypothetical protein
LGQLTPASDVDAWVASVVVRADTAGISVLQLLEKIEDRVSEVEVRTQLRSMVVSCAGRSLDEERHHRFDEAGALATLRLLDVRDIPKLECELPPEIIKVSLQVRCAEVPAVCSDMADIQIRLADGK